MRKNVEKINRDKNLEGKKLKKKKKYLKKKNRKKNLKNRKKLKIYFLKMPKTYLFKKIGKVWKLFFKKNPEKIS